MKLIRTILLIWVIEVALFISAAFSQTVSASIPMVWDLTSVTKDVFTTNLTQFANISAVNLYRSPNGTNNFTLLQVFTASTNALTIANQPSGTFWFYITFVNQFSESLPSNTNQIIIPGRPNPPQNWKKQ